MLLLAAGLLLLLLIRIATLPFKLGFRLILSTLLGYFCLFLLNWLGELLGMSISVNIVTALIVGVFGLPGLALLLFARWLLLL